jgi:hypothetical protein
VSAPLYVRDGSRFVVYDERRQHTPPIPVPVPVEPEPGEGQPWRVRVEPLPRCRHGSWRACRVPRCGGPHG